LVFVGRWVTLGASTEEYLMMSRGWFLLLGAAGLFVGCGKSEGGAAPVSESELPSKVASLLCRSMADCCQSEGFAFDSDACRAGYLMEVKESLNDYDPQKVTYDEQAAGECLAAAEVSIRCGEVEDDIPACERIFHGNVALGEPCGESRECQQPDGKRVTCTSEDGFSAQVCTVLGDTVTPHAKLGEACFTTCFEDEDCGGAAPVPAGGEEPLPTTEPAACYRDEGLFCDVGTCAKLVALGGPCTDYSSCAGDAFCDFNSQVCTAPRANGEPCEGSNECQSGRCVDSLAGLADPGTPSQPLCASRTSVSAEQCENDFMPDPQPTEPAPGAP
jgi:hypothetical protein